MIQTPKKPDSGKYLGLFLVLLLTAPQLVIPIAIIAALVITVKKTLEQQTARQDSTISQAKPVDDCPKKLFCFHKDKGEHHIRKGREIDPWDRPDIDISKYQRK